MAQRNAGSSKIASKWEWVAAAVSALILIAILGVLVTESAGSERPPDVQVRADSVVRVTDGWLAPFTAHNRAATTAADLVVTGELWDGATKVESSTVTLDYLPGGAERSGGLFFERDPRSLTLKLRAAGYQRP